MKPDNAAPNASLFVRYGLDSPSSWLIARAQSRMKSLVDRTEGLPVYAITPTVSPAQCGPAILPDVKTGQPILIDAQQVDRPRPRPRHRPVRRPRRIQATHLRGLATHAPYFHNGAAATIEDVVNFLDTILQAKFTDQDRADLAAFLRSL